MKVLALLQNYRTRSILTKPLTWILLSVEPLRTFKADGPVGVPLVCFLIPPTGAAGLLAEVTRFRRGFTVRERVVERISSRD